jgi:glyoxylase-like metal-dependent hydrolase (beta-lactamase superfamily II)/rhodanese-related sulfurtransferase
MEKDLNITVDDLRTSLENNEQVVVLDVRPKEQREEWQIPGSIYLDAYKRLNEGDNSVLDEVNIPENAKVVTVCAAGRTSRIAANALQKKGIEAYSLVGGMKNWSLAWNVAAKLFNGFEVLQVRRTGKGCLSYIISSNEEALIVDASLPVEVYQQLINKHNLTLKYVIETHIHADHLSRSMQVADFYQVPLFLPVPNKVQFSFNEVTKETIFRIGNVSVQTIPTPGHTLESVSYYIKDAVILTGDTLFIDGVGRPDLKANDIETRNRAGLLYQSLQHLMTLPGGVTILPAHTSKPVAFDGRVVAGLLEEANKEIKLLQVSEREFMDSVLNKLPATPPNYLAIVEKNLTGDLSDINPVELEAGANRCAIS